MRPSRSCRVPCVTRSIRVLAFLVAAAIGSVFDSDFLVGEGWAKVVDGKRG